MDYRSAIAWIIDRSGYEKGFVANPFIGDDIAALGLQRTRGLLERLGFEQPPVIHVAGTKGKGSTCAAIAALAQAAGRSTGVYATPHLHTFRERILLDGAPISESEFAAVAEVVAEADARVAAERPEIGEPTAFEVTTAMALLAFARAGVDLAVVEVGMGGRLDATNVVEPAVSVITSISMDHTAILGDSLADIAFEKGGIIKPGAPVVVAPQGAEALTVLRRIAEERHAPLFLAGRDWHTMLDDGATLGGPWGEWRGVRLALRGPHQVDNAGAAMMAVWMFDSSLLADEEAARAALSSVQWPGRFEQVGSAPDIYVDGAHNVDSMARLVDTLAEVAASPPLIVVGVGRDKDIEGMLAEAARLSPHVIATASHNPRAADPARVAEAARAAGLAAEIAPDVAAALDRARAAAAPSDVIVVTGSLYAVAEAREALGLAETPEMERALLYG